MPYAVTLDIIFGIAGAAGDVVIIIMHGDGNAGIVRIIHDSIVAGGVAGYDGSTSVIANGIYVVMRVNVYDSGVVVGGGNGVVCVVVSVICVMSNVGADVVVAVMVSVIGSDDVIFIVFVMDSGVVSIFGIVVGVVLVLLLSVLLRLLSVFV